MSSKNRAWKGLCLVFLGIVIGFLISPIKGTFLSNNRLHWDAEPHKKGDTSPFDDLAD